MNQDRKQIPVRIPPGLKERLQASAHENKRSVTREVEVILERALTPVVIDCGEVRS